MKKQHEAAGTIKCEGSRLTYERIKPIGKLYFSDLDVGERFLWGGEEHIKITELTPQTIGIVNNICLAPNTRSGQVSGMGSNVEVQRTGFKGRQVLTETQLKYFEDTLANIKQLDDDLFRDRQRLSTMAATVATLYGQFTGQPGYGIS